MDTPNTPDTPQILVEKNHAREALGRLPDVGVAALAGWTGLRLSRFRMPERVLDRHVHGPHPIVTLVLAGRTQSRLRYGRRDVDAQHAAGDLMCYSGALEIDRADWHCAGAELLSAEIDPARLLGGAEPPALPRPALNAGAPRFRDAGVQRLLRALWAEAQAGNPHGRLHADTLALGLASRLYGRFGTPVDGADPGLSRLQLAHVDAFIDAHLGEALTLEQLAQAAGLSRFHFARCFRAARGCSPYQHVLQRRLARARELLLHTRTPLVDVALQLGFSSQSHFNEACRQHLGCAPGALRRGRAAPEPPRTIPEEARPVVS